MIDEGAIDEKSGMNFSEYVAILSGNTDLLDKARVWLNGNGSQLSMDSTLRRIVSIYAEKPMSLLLQSDSVLQIHAFVQDSHDLYGTLGNRPIENDMFARSESV